ncbi:hypothetical protein BY996DRAFT_6525745 [Phakopsora pachyrhizi]|nr:hypothetical protein BY996DRAFT_6525745 [Phakopsora pachyrhizi]
MTAARLDGAELTNDLVQEIWPTIRPSQEILRVEGRIGILDDRGTRPVWAVAGPASKVAEADMILQVDSSSLDNTMQQLEECWEGTVRLAYKGVKPGRPKPAAAAGTVETAPRSGRPRKLVDRDLQGLQRLVSINQRARRVNNNIEKVSWPAQSLDLNPIEHLWKIMKTTIGRFYQPKNLTEFTEAIHKVYSEIPPQILENFVVSMPGKMAEVIASKGGHTHY